jgi:hypothetical protein
METLKLIIEFLKVITWPITAIIILLLFRKQINNRFKDLNKVEFGSLKMTMNPQQAVALIEEAATEFDEINKDSKISPEIKDVLKSQLLTEKFGPATQISSDPPMNSTVKTEPVTLSGYDIKDRTMLAFTTGETYESNLKYRVYFDPAYRNHNTPFRYLGMYNDKTIYAVGEVETIVACNYTNGELTGENIDKLTTPDQRNRIIGIIQDVHANAGYDVSQNHKFFLIKQFYDTNFQKSTPYGIRAKKYFWLDQIEGFRIGMSAAELAALLENKTWK